MLCSASLASWPPPNNRLRWLHSIALLSHAQLTRPSCIRHTGCCVPSPPCMNAPATEQRKITLGPVRPSRYNVRIVLDILPHDTIIVRGSRGPVRPYNIYDTGASVIVRGQCYREGPAGPSQPVQHAAARRGAHHSTSRCTRRGAHVAVHTSAGAYAYASTPPRINAATQQCRHAAMPPKRRASSRLVVSDYAVS